MKQFGLQTLPNYNHAFWWVEKKQSFFFCTSISCREQLKIGRKGCLSAAKVLLLLLTQLIFPFQLIKHILRNRLDKILILPQFIEQ